MGITASKQVAANEKAAADAKHAQIEVLKDALLKKVEEHEERLHQMEQKSDPHLAFFKKELLQMVDEHVSEHAKMEQEQKQLALFKDDLMAKVHEHMDELHRAEDKAKLVQTFKDEMIQKVQHHSDAHSEYLAEDAA